MPFAEMRPTTGYCEHFENGIKNFQTITIFFIFAIKLIK